MAKRRTYTDEFRREAVRVMMTRGERSDVFADPDEYYAQQRGFEDFMLAGNSLLTWLRYLWKPTTKDRARFTRA